jgi:hypothetical protein
MALGFKMSTEEFLCAAKIKFVTAAQSAVCTQFHMDPPIRVSIYDWNKKFKQKVCDATVDRFRTCFQRSLQHSMRRASRQLQLPQTKRHLNPN